MKVSQGSRKVRRRGKIGRIQRTLDTILSLDLLRPPLGILIAVVPKDDICACFGVRVGDSQTNTTPSTGHYGRSAL